MFSLERKVVVRFRGEGLKIGIQTTAILSSPRPRDCLVDTIESIFDIIEIMVH